MDRLKTHTWDSVRQGSTDTLVPSMQMEMGRAFVSDTELTNIVLLKNEELWVGYYLWILLL